MLDPEGKTQKDFTILPSSISDTTFSVKFSVEGLHGKIDVDLLPTFHFKGIQYNILGASWSLFLAF